MQGAPSIHSSRCGRLRIIPADAGSTNEMDLTLCRPEDHPRGCGEHSYPIDKMMLDEESSPRMRGAPGASREAEPALRIIPADAGSTQ